MPSSETKANDLQSRAVMTKDRSELQEDNNSEVATEAAEESGPALPKRVSSAEIFGAI